MTTITPSRPGRDLADGADEPIVLKRRAVDSVLIAIGAVVTAAFVVAGALLLWGANFAGDYVDDELTSQNIYFPPAAALEEEGRDDLVKYAEELVNTGPEAEAYASFIDGHLQEIADGATYADLGAPQREAAAAVETATAEGADEATVADLEEELATITGQRDTLFKGETLRGLLLTAYAWDTVGSIALYAAIAAFLAGIVMLALVVLGLFHHHKVAQQS
jgi:hypothetical protein